MTVHRVTSLAQNGHRFSSVRRKTIGACHELFAKCLGGAMIDLRIITTPEELEALAREDADAVVLASEAGAARSMKALWEMCRAGGMWGLPAAVIATGEQVRAAREAMEQEHG